MDLKWYYDIEKNGFTDCVATLYKANGCPVLQVCKGYDSYISCPCGEYDKLIHRYNVLYEDVNRFVEEKEKRGTIFTESERKLEEIKFACAFLESNFKMQVNTILNLFS